MSSRLHNIPVIICSLLTTPPCYKPASFHRAEQPMASTLVVPCRAPGNLKVTPEETSAINTRDLEYRFNDVIRTGHRGTGCSVFLCIRGSDERDYYIVEMAGGVEQDWFNAGDWGRRGSNASDRGLNWSSRWAWSKITRPFGGRVGRNHVFVEFFATHGGIYRCVLQIWSVIIDDSMGIDLTHGALGWLYQV